MADFKFSIVRHVGVISGRGNGWSREINLVKWNDGEAKVDIRDWSPDRTAMRKGLTFNRQEFFTLVKLLKDIKASEIVDGTAIPVKNEQNLSTHEENAATLSQETIVPEKAEQTEQKLTLEDQKSGEAKSAEGE